MKILSYDGKEIPFDPSRFDNPDYIAFLERIQVEHEKAEKKRNERLLVIVGIASAIIALAAAGAAWWTGYEAHLTRVEDERPYLRVRFSGVENMQVHTIKSESHNLDEPVIEISAFGKTPATGVIVNAQCLSTTRLHLLDPDRSRTFPIERVPGTIFPTESMKIPCFDDYTAPHLGSEELVFHGIVTYTDLGGRRYETPFCYIRSLNTIDFEDCTIEPVK
jgi:hypothetical protein